MIFSQHLNIVVCLFFDKSLNIPMFYIVKRKKSNVCKFRKIEARFLILFIQLFRTCKKYLESFKPLQMYICKRNFALIANKKKSGNNLKLKNENQVLSANALKSRLDENKQCAICFCRLDTFSSHPSYQINKIVVLTWNKICD